MTALQDGTIVVALWNYAEPDEAGSPKTFRIQLRNAGVTKYRMQVVDPDHSSSLKAFQAMGRPASPGKELVKGMIAASQLQPPKEYSLNQPVTVAPQGLAILDFY